MTTYAYRAEVIALFENIGDSNEAQAWVLERLEPIGEIQSIDINKWINPYQNQVEVMDRPTGKTHKFTLRVKLSFVIEGGYADAQKRIVDALLKGRETSYINIQTVKLSRSEMR